jgi:UDP-glucuronate 4-epimerase
MKILITGGAGFIGSATTLRLLERGDEVVGIDNLNDYYDVNLKKARLARQIDHPNYVQITADLEDHDAIATAFSDHKPNRVINLAAQAGVRYAAINPYPYVSTNVQGFLNILEGCRHCGVEHLVYASTSSVYGANTDMPFSEHHNTQHPLTLYAATKKANEMMAHAYSHLYKIPTTGLRFFTVYGPWGRPDMALFMFTKKILAGEPIPVFNHGKHSRSFTYIDDIVEGVIRVLDKPATVDSDWDARHPDPASAAAPYRLYNIGAEQQVELLRYIEVLEDCLGKKAQMQMLPLQDGDVPDTTADVTGLMQAIGYKPRVNVEEGVKNFVDWYRAYYG